MTTLKQQINSCTLLALEKLIIFQVKCFNISSLTFEIFKGFCMTLLSASLKYCLSEKSNRYCYIHIAQTFCVIAYNFNQVNSINLNQKNENSYRRFCKTVKCISCNILFRSKRTGALYLFRIRWLWQHRYCTELLPVALSERKGNFDLKQRPI